LRKRCVGANMVYSRAERLFILRHYVASKSFAAVREAFNSAYPDKEVLNRTTIYRHRSVCVSSRRRWTAVLFVLRNK
jgi:hypothetical protein